MENAKRIVIITHSLPERESGEGIFLIPELSIAKKVLSQYSAEEAIRIEVWPGFAHFESDLQIEGDFTVGKSLLEARRRMGKWRKFLVLVCAIGNFRQLFTGSSGSPLRTLRKDILSLFTWCDQYLVMRRALRNLETDEAVNILCFYSFWLDGYAGALGMYYKGQHGKPFLISRAHGGDLFEFQNLQPNQARTVSQLDAVYCASKGGVEALISQGCLVSRVSHARMSIEDYNQESFPQRLIPDEFKQSERLNVISIASNHPVKGIPSLIIDLEYVATNFMPINLFLVGLPLEFELKSRTSDSNDLIVSNLGYLENKKLREMLLEQSFSAAINYSSSEATPVSLMEAICAGIPIIGRNVGGVGEIVVNGITGELLEENATASDLCSALRNIVNNQSSLKKTARDFWKENFDAKKTYSEFYENMLSELSVNGD